MKTLNNINNRVEEHEIPFPSSFHIYFTREHGKQREHPKNLSPEKYNIPKEYILLSKKLFDCTKNTLNTKKLLLSI